MIGSTRKRRASRRGARPDSRLAIVVALVLAAGFWGCGRSEKIERKRVADEDKGFIVPPPVDHERFKKMELPESHIVRLPAKGAQYRDDRGPLFTNLCLNCHGTSQTSRATEDWAKSRHALVGVGCNDCHGAHERGFLLFPPPERCRPCHPREVEDLQAGKHKATPASGIKCTSCHPAHAFDLETARDAMVCVTCHRDSKHTQDYFLSKMGAIYKLKGREAAAYCQTCHVLESSVHGQTSDYRNDYVPNHDVSATVKKDPRDEGKLEGATIEELVKVCMRCHAERVARYRLEHADTVIKEWLPGGFHVRPDESERSAADEAGKAATE